jgi:DNA repair protein RecN (Recombination protein N)
LFDLSEQPQLIQELDESGLGQDADLVVRRVVSRSGRNRAYLNGSLATLSQLQTFTERLVAIYGQHEHQSLQRVETHLALLDAFGKLKPLRSEYAEAFRSFRNIEKRLADLEEAERDRQQRLDLLSFQSREIEAAAPHPGEDEELAAERLLLQNGERLAAASRGGFEILYGGEEAVCGAVDKIASDLEELLRIDPELGPLAESLRSAQYALEDVAAQLRDYGRRVEFEPERLDQVEERLATLGHLKRKYGSDLAQVLEHKTTVDRELEELTDVEATRDKLVRDLRASEAELRNCGETLTTARREAARNLHKAVETELASLAMPRARFEVRLVPLEEPGLQGLEKVEFFLAPNPGEAPKPLSRIASGGELSRIMLALRRAAPPEAGVETLVFDEVDAGIGGEAATAVGEKLRRVARGLQVLCITHLPQVAAFADHHYRVEKLARQGRTTTLLAHLEGEERVREMARMLGGARITERTLDHARDLINQSLQA